METETFNEQKFKELILYIATQCQDDIFWGATKLNKQLFFSDFLAYRNFGTPITAADYMALEYGPVPRRLLPIRADMIEEEDCRLEAWDHQERIVALRDPDLTFFAEHELSLIGEVIAILRDSTADEVSDLSHRFAGWLAAVREGQAVGRHVSIPYATAAVEQVTPDEDVIAEGFLLADKYEWPV